MLQTRVLVVDDAPTGRSLLADAIRMSPDMQVVGVARDGATARDTIRTSGAEVIVLAADVARPGDVELLEYLVCLRPMPLVMVSSHADAGSDAAMRAVEIGAAEFIGKFGGGTPRQLEAYAEELVDKIRAAKSTFARRARQETTVPSAPPAVFPSMAGAGKIIFVGASTGGTEALKVFLMGMPENCPPILVVQHMPESFTASFARRLDSLCAPHILESQGNEKVSPGTVYIAPGHSHLRIRRLATGYGTELLQTLAVNRHRPSVDVLFESAAELVGRQAVGVILTGMGKDGAQGLLQMRRAGARTYGQDASSCVVYGMPREAFAIGAVGEQVHLDEMARRVLGDLGKAL
ncbi:MAG: protein-glutamate methylesterase/protein-glutamine glutaminase [Betaproteobacteria bacterium]